jgi:two-component system, OmpR family, response regulator
MRVLVIEDEADLAEIVRQLLVESGFSVDLAHDGETGLFKAESVEYDAVLLDLMLPRMHGLEILRRLREQKKTPVLVLTARDAKDDKIKGLNLGADDYLTKPFESDELVARLRALIRRSANQPAPTIVLGDLEVNTAERTVYLRGKPLELRAMEFKILHLLLLRRGMLVSKTMIYEHVYDDDDDSLSNVVDVHISNLRKKLGSGLIETRRGEGYRIRG